MLRNGKNEDHSYVVSNNLAYVAAYKQAPTFVIYPTSPADSPKNDATKLNLWESSWGLAHEFGHHVLRTHTGKAEISENSLGDNEAIEGGAEFFPAPIETRGTYIALAGSNRSVGPREHWQAVNEGFADLFAFYSLNQQEKLARNIPCMDISRDVTSAKFASGFPKSIDDSVMADYTSSDYISVDHCRQPNFQTPHSIGAILAYGVNLLFQASQEVSQDGSEKAGELLLRWADELRILANHGASEISLSEMIRLAAVVAGESGNRLSSGQCDVIRRVFPVWQDDWFAPGSHQLMCADP